MHYPDASPDIARVLGFAEAQTPLRLASSIEQGLPLAALDRLVALLSPDDDGLRYAFVPRATLARRTRTQRLSPDESAKLARVAAVWAASRETWGSDEAARDFLNRRHMLLHDRRPLEVALATDVGARLVEDILGRLRYGTAV